MIKGPAIDKAPVSKRTIIEHMGICPVYPVFLVLDKGHLYYYS